MRASKIKIGQCQRPGPATEAKNQPLLRIPLPWTILSHMQQKFIAIANSDCVHQSSPAGGTATLVNQYKDPSIEVNKFILRSEENYNLIPPGSEGALKVYTLLSGELYCLETRQAYLPGSVFILQSHNNLVSIRTIQDSVIVMTAIKEESYESSRLMFAHVFETMIAIQKKDDYTYNHCMNVHRLIQKMLGRLNYSGPQARNLLWAARYHDIGKIHIEDSLLNKPGRLDPAEFEIMKGHVFAGKDLILEYFNHDTWKIISQHHERLDGSGYPQGLQAEAIMEEAKILAICDSYDAMISDRVYKKGKTPEEAIQELRSLAGSQYDATLLEVMVASLEASDRP